MPHLLPLTDEFAAAINTLAESRNISAERAHSAIKSAVASPEFCKMVRAESCTLGEDGLYLEFATNHTYFPKISKSMLRLIHHHVLLHLEHQTALTDYDHLQWYRHRLVRGHIERISADGSLVVTLVDEELVTADTHYARCPPTQQTVRELREGKYYSGASKWFYCTGVTICQHDEGKRGKRLSIDVTLSRTALKLPERLIKKALSTTSEIPITIKSLNRYPGKLSVVSATRKIPKAILLSVMEELDEGIKVVCPLPVKGKASWPR